MYGELSRLSSAATMILTAHRLYFKRFNPVFPVLHAPTFGGLARRTVLNATTLMR